MHRKTKDYLDEIDFWQKARARLLQQAAELRRHQGDAVTPDVSRALLDDLLHKCGLDTLRRARDRAGQHGPETTGNPPPRDPLD